MRPLFHIRETTGKGLIDSKPTFPYFQRRSTWKSGKQFELLVSIFKGFPLGTVVVKHEGTEYLLIDGRQRYEALQSMLKPDEVWKMASKAIKGGLKLGMEDDELVEAFKGYVDDYLFGADRDLASELSQAEVVREDHQQDAEQELLEPEDQESRPYEEPEGDSGDLESAEDDELLLPVATVHPYAERLDPALYGDLHLLLELLLFRKRCGLTKAFNLSRYVEAAPLVRGYIADTPRGGRRVDEAKLVTWIEFRAGQPGAGLQPAETEFLEVWLEQGEPTSPHEVRLRTYVHEHWSEISEALRHFAVLRDHVHSAKFGYVELTEEATPDDQQRIFDNINRGGVPLTMAEILSARRTWSMEIPVRPGSSLPQQVIALRRRMGLDVSMSPRRWDYAATLLDRVDITLLFGQPEDWRWNAIKDNHFGRKVNLGFRLLSGRYADNLMRNGVEHLPRLAPPEVWGSEELESRLQAALERIADIWLFTRLRRWEYRLLRMSESLALAFALLAEKKWREVCPDAERPPARTSPASRTFRTYVVQVLDLLVYQYLRGDWQGGGDRKAAELLKKAELPFPSSIDWASLVEELLAQVDPEPSKAETFLTYVAAVLDLVPDQPEPGQVDHIIVKALFKGAPSHQRAQRDRLTNLDLLPRSINNIRGAKSLDELSAVDKERLEHFTRIRTARFSEFTAPAHVDALHEARAPLFRDWFLNARKAMWEDPSAYAGPGDLGLI